MLKIAYLALFVFLNGCAQIPIKNTEWCGDLGEFGASCFNTLSEDTRDISFEDWNKERFGMICTKAQNFSDWKAIILKLCSLHPKRCSYDDKKKVLIFNEKINGFIIKSNDISSF